MLCAKVLAILYIFVNLSNGYYQNHYRHGHNCYYYDQQCAVRRGPSICKEWCLVYYFDGNCYRPKYDCCIYKEKPGYCSVDRQLCTSPFLYYSTRIYECFNDYSCPIGYKCCKDSCYVHKICKPCTDVPPHPVQTTSRPTRDTEETTPRFTITTERLTTTRIPETTTVLETTTTKLPETTTQKGTTLGPTTVTTQKETTQTPMTTTEKPTTLAPTTLKETTTKKVPITTTPSLITTQMTTWRTPMTTAPEITTERDTDGSGSGDFDIPEPESARYMLPTKHFDGLEDDEDYVLHLMK